MRSTRGCKAALQARGLELLEVAGAQHPLHSSRHVSDIDRPQIQSEEMGTLLHLTAKHGLRVAHFKATSYSKTVLLFGIWSKVFVHHQMLSCAG